MAYVRNAVLVAAFSAYMIYYPIGLAFSAHEAQWMKFIELGLELLFFVDFLFMFNTSYINESGEFVTSRYEIAKRYVRGWFVADLFSSVPVHFLIFNNLGANARGVDVFAKIGFLFLVERLLHVLRIAHFL